ncbi:MAG: class I ribonucleotide reductase maintenance protein YfaE [Saccharospirillaceae bacterium]|nr:class I ribonucleotide reductase maintenance protein YfaE [Saccharospirillaceae bacterium]MCD8531666.1 class I ribonucleotide reductase maintenance protein YfaE [Saccharospirillaceae bacterium]
MQKPLFSVLLDDGREVHFRHAASLLESLEAQDVAVHYQCREGYCGSCRVQLLEGNVHYAEEPMAWLNEGDILPCCCIPKSDIKIKL